MHKKEKILTCIIIISIAICAVSIIMSIWTIGTSNRTAKENRNYGQQKQEGRRKESNRNTDDTSEQSPEKGISEETSEETSEEKCDRVKLAEDYIKEVREKALADGSNEEFMTAFEEAFWEGFYENHVCDICN